MLRQSDDGMREEGVAQRRSLAFLGWFGGLTPARRPAVARVIKDELRQVAMRTFAPAPP
jgi:hypothetical protein